MPAERDTRRDPVHATSAAAAEAIAALFRRMRYRDAAALAAARLKQTDDPEHAAGLRLARARALWLTSGFPAARPDLEKAAASARTPRGRARVEAAWAFYAWKEQRLGEARQRLAAARLLEPDPARPDRLARAGIEAGVERDAGRLDEALRLQGQRVAASEDPGELGSARGDRAELMVLLGRWGEARADLQAAEELLCRDGDLGGVTRVRLRQALVELTAGDLAGVRDRLDRVQEVLGAHSDDIRAAGERWLAEADLELAARQPARAEAAAAEALRLFALVQDRAGECLSRKARSHALCALDRSPEAEREAGRALRGVASGRWDVAAVAGLALGRARLRHDRAAAAEAFARVLETADRRSGVHLAARLGALLARGLHAEHPDVELALAALDMWGDRRLSALCRAELERLRPGAAAAPGPAVSAPPPAAAPAPRRGSRYPEMVGECAALEALFDDMDRVAETSLPVHIFGETGTGKERVARALHRRSRRRDRPFVPVNASSLNDELFESELFGHRRGAFTGAVADHDGYVARAEGGTLFLDEIADLSPRAQAKLLRFLNDGEYCRRGDSAPRRGDVRVLTATNVVLADRVAAGGFRDDLMFRLNRLMLALPPLRERGDDVVILAHHFLRAAAEAEGRKPPVLAAEAIQTLRAYAWPGNVRELEGEMQRLVCLAGPGPLGREQLSPRLRAAAPPRASSLRQALQRCEHDCILQALRRHDGNRARAARSLGITRQGLVGKIRRLGIG